MADSCFKIQHWTLEKEIMSEFYVSFGLKLHKYNYYK